MSWNYRIFRFDPDEGEEDSWYCIKRVYYDNKGKIDGYGECDSSPGGTSIEDLRGDLELIQQAFNRPVLIIRDVEIVESPCL